MAIPYILYQKLFCAYYLVCTSPSLSGISTLSQEGVSTLLNGSSDGQCCQKLASLIYSARSYCAYFWCATFQHWSGISTHSQEVGLNSLQSQFRLTMVLVIYHLLIYSTRSYYVYFWCAPLQHFQVFLLLGSRVVSTLFGVSAQTDSDIRI